MPTIPLHLPNRSSSDNSPKVENPLPPLLQTPSGVALLELQGTIHFPQPSTNDSASSNTSTQIGKLVFPLYNPSLNGADDTKWMKRVYFYVGKNQRMSGEVKKLVKPFAIIRKVDKSRGQGRGDVEMGGLDEEGQDVGQVGQEDVEELEIVEIVRYKIVFSTRPEPVSDEVAEEVG